MFNLDFCVVWNLRYILQRMQLTRLKKATTTSIITRATAAKKTHFEISNKLYDNDWVRVHGEKKINRLYNLWANYATFKVKNARIHRINKTRISDLDPMKDREKNLAMKNSSGSALMWSLSSLVEQETDQI